MGNSTERLTLEILARDLASGKVGSVVGALDQLAQKGGLVGSVLQGVGQGLGQTLNPLNLVNRAVDVVTDTLGAATSAASDLSESQSKVDQVFTESSSTIHRWATDSARDFGLSKAAALEAAGTFGNFIQALGNTEAEANSMSRTLVQLAADLASFNNQDIDEVILALRSGLAGEAEPMRRLGVSISAARIEANLLARGVVRSKSEITDAMKVSERYAIIMQDTAKAHGDFARTSQGSANSSREWAAVVENSLAKLGETIDPLVARFTQFASDALPKMLDFIGGLGAAFNDLNRSINPHIALEQDLESAVRKAAEGTDTQAEAVLAHMKRVDDARSRLEAYRREQEQTAFVIEQLARTQYLYTEYQGEYIDSLERAKELVLENSAAADGLETVLAKETRIRRQAAQALNEYNELGERDLGIMGDRSAAINQATDHTRRLEEAQTRANGQAARATMAYILQTQAEKDLAAAADEAAAKHRRQLSSALETAGTLFRDLVDDANAAGKAIRNALNAENENRTLKQLRSERDRLRRQERRAFEDRNWEAYWLIQQRKSEVEEEIKARRQQRALFEERRREANREARWVDRKAEKYGVTQRKVSRILRQEKGDVDAVITRLEKLDKTKAEPEVDVKTANAIATIKRVQDALDSIEDEQVYIDIQRRGGRAGSGSGGGGGGSLNKKTARGGVYMPGDGGFVGESSMERIQNRGGVTYVTPLRAEGAGRANTLIVNVNVNGGNFLGTPQDAQRWASEVTPHIIRELERTRR